MKKLLLLLIAFASTTMTYADDKPIEIDGWKVNGLTMMVGQLDGKDFSDKTHPQYNNILKFRLGAEKQVFDDVLFHVEFHDSRLMFHEATTTEAGTHSFDLFQGYIDARNILGTKFGIKAGRFQMKMGTEKYIGPSFWHVNERVFDGAILSYRDGSFTGELFFTRHNDTTIYMLKTLTNYYPEDPGVVPGNNVYGLWTSFDSPFGCKVHLFGYGESFYNDNLDHVRHTLGLNHLGKFGALSTTVEFAFQTGNYLEVKDDAKIEKDVSAYHLGLRADYMLKPVKLTAGLDMLSGTAPDDQAENINTFNNVLGSKHKFFGLMDYFLSVPKGTKNLGLNDFYLGAALPKLTNKLAVSLTGHYFLANQESSSGLSDFGSELDLVFIYKPFKGTIIKAGGSVFMQGDLMKEFWTVDGTERTDMSYWAFVMLVVKI